MDGTPSSSRRHHGPGLHYLDENNVVTATPFAHPDVEISMTVQIGEQGRVRDDGGSHPAAKSMNQVNGEASTQ